MSKNSDVKNNKKLYQKWWVFMIAVIAIIVSVYSSNYTTLMINETSIDDVNLELVNSTPIEILDINPYKNKDFKELKINEKEVKFDKSIKDETKTKLNKIKSKDDGEYVLIRFNNNPSKSEMKQLKQEGIEILEYVGSNSYYVKISKKFDDLFEIKKNDLRLKSEKLKDKYLIRNIAENKPEYKLSKHLQNNNNIGSWAKDDNGNVYLIVQFHKDVTLETAEKLMNEKGFEVLSRLEFINALTIKVYGGEK